jgi:NADPH-dependent stearoyl-CoA 9-desaturase
VRALCDKYDIPYTTGPLHRQYGQALRTIMKMSLPNGMTSSDQPDPPSPSVDRGRKTDAERPQRRTETGGWSRRPAAS